MVVRGDEDLVARSEPERAHTVPKRVAPECEQTACRLGERERQARRAPKVDGRRKGRPNTQPRNEAFRAMHAVVDRTLSPSFSPDDADAQHTADEKPIGDRAPSGGRQFPECLLHYLDRKWRNEEVSTSSTDARSDL
jgi:hypothetical protein